jgi:hypothetical protein
MRIATPIITKLEAETAARDAVGTARADNHLNVGSALRTKEPNERCFKITAIRNNSAQCYSTIMRLYPKAAAGVRVATHEYFEMATVSSAKLRLLAMSKHPE